MKKNGKADETIETAARQLRRIAKECNLNEPEQAKETLANLQWQNSTKKNVTKILIGYYKFIGKQWTPPTYKIEQRIPFIPTETELNQLIDAGTTNTAALLQCLKETGMRIGEASLLEWINIDTERKTVNITPEKGSNPRILPITDKLIGMLNNLNKTHETVFKAKKHHLQETFTRLRRRTATKLSNPRLLKITLHTFRHWKGTMEYHKTKDIMYVKKILGHKSIESTMFYINIEQALFLADSDEWNCKTATTPQEAITLIEAGFQYVNNLGEIALYKKRK